ncbi:helix-turn-helix domain-containing protein [Lysinibacillus xylanilyticus]|uniref:helix-turn-helix domain-containing protein n=1 Tax=Lysinibacillus xylanilyticus TaxID=582475 RepID=UPI0037F5D087
MNATTNLVSKAFREIRGGKTQSQLSMDLDLSRETVSKIENGRSKLPPDISRNLMKKYDDPRLAMAVQYEYTGTGPVLDGPNVDLHRCSVRERTIEEEEEFIEALKRTNFSKPAHALTFEEIENIKKAIEEGIEAETAKKMWLMKATEYIGMSYSDAYTEHYADLRQKGFII